MTRRISGESRMSGIHKRKSGIQSRGDCHCGRCTWTYARIWNHFKSLECADGFLGIDLAILEPVQQFHARWRGLV